MSATRQLCQKIQEISFDTLPADVVHVARGAVMDGIANMLAGSREPLAQILLTHLSRFTGDPAATVVGHDVQADPFQAAFANGIFCHSMDFELMWYPPTHPTGPTLAAILAVSELRSVSGRDALAALVAGFEIQGELNRAIFETGTRWPNGMHPPGLLGPFGAAASAGKLLELDPWQMQHALGIAASRAGGLMANTGTMTKSSHSGHSARVGLESAMLAEVGFTGSDDILEATHGFNEVFFDGRMHLDKVVSSYGQPFRMVDPGVIVKKHPSQYPTHWSIDAALEIRSIVGFAPEDVAHVAVEVGADNESARVERPSTGLAGKFSISYTVAAALLDGVIDIDTFRDERLHSPDMQETLNKVEIIRHESVRAMDFAQAWSRVTVTMTDGTAHTARVDRPLGIWDNPLPWHLWVEKYQRCATRAVSDARAAEILTLIEAFEELSDVGKEFVTLLRGQGRS
jgi:2-methylcitrate dehydratase PrpD